MSLVEDKDALQVGSIVGDVDLFLILGKTLDVDNGYFGLSACPLLCLILSELCHQFRPCIGSGNQEASGFKLLFGLFQKVKTVNNEIELGYLVLSCVEVVKDICQII